MFQNVLYINNYLLLECSTLLKDLLICFVHIGKKKRSHKHLKMLPLYTFIKEKKTNVHATIIKAFLFSQLPNRLLKHLEQDQLAESQCGFRIGRGTIDMILAARQLQEKSMEQCQDLFITFVDLNKAFDSVRKDAFEKF